MAGEKPAARPARTRKTAAKAAAPKGESRVVIGLDTNLMARDALTLAARLAASIDATVKGVFVEDENLLSLCGLPFAREISFSGEVRAVDAERMLRAMRAQAETARRVLERVAAEEKVQFSFDILRGRSLAALAGCARAEDTVVIRSPEASTREIGRAVRAATSESRADVLLVARGVAAKGVLGLGRSSSIVQQGAVARPIAAVDDGSSLGQSCSAFAETLARRSGVPFRRIFVKGRDMAEIAAAARQAGAGLIVVNADWLRGDEDAARLSAIAGSPLLLLGGERASPAKKSKGD
jgi:hypothetical protein